MSNILIIGVANLVNNHTGSGGVSRNISNLVNSEYFKKEFNYDLFDDSNYSKNFLHTLLSTVSNFLSLSKILKKGSYDLALIHCNSISFDFFKKFLILILIKISGTKMVVRYGGSLSFNFFSIRLFYFIYKLFFSLQDGIIVQGRTGKNFYKKFKKKNVFTEANFVVDTNPIKSSKKFLLNNDLVILLVAGSDYIRKGFLDSLEAVSLLESQDLHRFIALGCNKYSKKEIIDRGLDKRVEIFEELNYMQMKKIMALSHVLVLPSYNEGLPNIILEAMSNGLVVISTRVGSISDLVKNDENGYFVEVGDKINLSRKFAELNKKRHKFSKISVNNITKINKFYSEKKVVPKLINFISKI